MKDTRCSMRSPKHTIDFIKIESVSCLLTKHYVSEGSMPSDEEVTQRAGRLQALTGFTERACTVLRPPFEPALAGYR
jgi:hypothetical protein